MNASDESKARVLVVGGGIAGLEAALVLKAFCGPRIAIGLISPGDTYTYRPLAVAEPFGLAERFTINLDTFGRTRDVEIHLGEADAVDTGARRVHCSNGTSYDYDYLILATGARRRPFLDDAVSFVGPEGIERFRRTLEGIEAGEVRSVAFCAPVGAGWYLPMYELALMTAAFADARGVAVELTVVTPEDQPLASFGPHHSDEVAKLVEEAGISVRAGAHAASYEGGRLALVPEGSLTADEVVAMPALEGPGISGLPADPSGFIPVDGACRVEGCERELAAGDATNFPVKQGGIAGQMARAAAGVVAAELGELETATPFRPTLDGTLLTGAGAHHLRQSLVTQTSEDSLHELSRTWLPLAKVNASFLVDYLADRSDFPSASADLD